MMKWIERLSDCVDYIEENLTGEIDMEVLCDKACLTRLYFFRLFEAVTGIGVSEYIRRRKMTLAVRELMSGKRKIIDLAYEFGYSSPEAFSRAFKSVHGVSPSQIMNMSESLASFHRISFSISIKGEKEMKYKIVEKESFKVLGCSIETTSENGQNMKDIPQFWERVNSDGTSEKMCKLASGEPGMFGICFERGDSREFSYTIAVPYSDGDREDFEIYDVPSSKWAIFESIGPMPDSIQNVWHRIFAEWLPATGQEIAPLPQLEYYYPGNPSSKDYKSEVWIPLN